MVAKIHYIACILAEYALGYYWCSGAVGACGTGGAVGSCQTEHLCKKHVICTLHHARRNQSCTYTGYRAKSISVQPLIILRWLGSTCHVYKDKHIGMVNTAGSSKTVLFEFRGSKRIPFETYEEVICLCQVQLQSLVGSEARLVTDVENCHASRQSGYPESNGI